MAVATRGTVKIIQGNAACVEGAVAAGCRFFAGYPITPSSEIAEGMSQRLPQVGGVFLQMEDEIASIVALVGASYGGAKPMTATSGPGFSLMQEGIGLAAITEAPCVVVNVQRGGPSTGQSTFPSQGDVYQARFGSNGDYSIIALAPSTSQEMFDLTVRAFNLAEKYRVPTFVMADEIVAHTREKVLIPPPEEIEVVSRKKPQVPREQFLTFKADADLVPPMPAFTRGYKMAVTSTVHSEDGWRTDPHIAAALVERLLAKIENNAKEIIQTSDLYLDDADTVVVSYGAVARSALRAVKDARARGAKAGWLKLKTLWPFPTDLMFDLAGRVRRILVPEMNSGRMSREADLAAKGLCEVVSLPKLGGRCHIPAEICAAIIGGR